MQTESGIISKKEPGPPPYSKIPYSPHGFRKIGSDNLDTQNISDALARHVDINPDSVDVEVKEGVVHPSGSVSDRRACQAVEDTVRYSPGVMDNDIDRLAIVGNRKRGKGLAVFAKPFTTAEVRFFEVADMDRARE